MRPSVCVRLVASGSKGLPTVSAIHQQQPPTITAPLPPRTSYDPFASPSVPESSKPKGAMGLSTDQHGSIVRQHPSPRPTKARPSPPSCPPTPNGVFSPPQPSLAPSFPSPPLPISSSASALPPHSIPASTLDSLAKALFMHPAPSKQRDTSTSRQTEGGRNTYAERNRVRGWTEEIRPRTTPMAPHSGVDSVPQLNAHRTAPQERASVLVSPVNAVSDIVSGQATLASAPADPPALHAIEQDLLILFPQPTLQPLAALSHSNVVTRSLSSHAGPTTLPPYGSLTTLGTGGTLHLLLSPTTFYPAHLLNSRAYATRPEAGLAWQAEEEEPWGGAERVRKWDVGSGGRT